jgi:aspartate/methionine/tyrosine aminotransferase
MLNRISKSYLTKFKAISRASSTKFIPPVANFKPYPYTHEHEIPCQINLGTEHSIIDPPSFISSALVYACTNNLNQYTRYAGYPALVEQIAETYAEKLGREIDPMEEVLTSTGSTGCLTTILHCLLRRGDEVVVFEPFNYPWVAAMRMRGVNVKFCPLNDDGSLDVEALEGVVSENTNLIVLDNPTLPDGNVFSEAELRQIARIAKASDGEHKTYVVSNESLHYQTKNYEDHFSFAKIEGVWDRTFTLYSAGFEFDCRGHRVGWVIGPKDYIPHFGSYQVYAFFSTITMGQVSLSINSKSTPHVKPLKPWSNHTGVNKHTKTTSSSNTDSAGKEPNL